MEMLKLQTMKKVKKLTKAEDGKIITKGKTRSDIKMAKAQEAWGKANKIQMSGDTSANAVDVANRYYDRATRLQNKAKILKEKENKKLTSNKKGGSVKSKRK